MKERTGGGDLGHTELPSNLQVLGATLLNVRLLRDGLKWSFSRSRRSNEIGEGAMLDTDRSTRGITATRGPGKL